jgi:hypothetical protein
MKHTITHIALTLTVAACAGHAAEVAAPAVEPTKAQPQPRLDTSWDVASGYCETLWTDTGMTLHETPVWDSRRGLDCVYDYPTHEPYLCDENLGAKVESYDMVLCVVPVPYAWACRWIAPSGRCSD